MLFRSLPNVDCPVVDADASGLLASLESVAVKRGIAVKYETSTGHRFGYATDKGESIVIDDAHPTGQRAKTLAHELAHCALHFGKHVLSLEGSDAATVLRGCVRRGFILVSADAP